MSIVAGFLFPVCECGIVPIARSLVKKGVSTSGVVMFLLSAPVFNPITLGATIAAFPAHPSVWIGRILVAQILTITIGWIFVMYKDVQGSELTILGPQSDSVDQCDTCNVHAQSSKEGNKAWAILDATYHEFQHVFMYVVIGASLTSFLQLVLSKQYFLTIGDFPILGIASFMLLALVLSVCSSVDAFVILPFASHMPLSALLAFLNFGPLIDIKNILLFRAYFTKRFQYWYFGLVTVILFLVVFLSGYILSNLFMP